MAMALFSVFAHPTHAEGVTSAETIVKALQARKTRSVSPEAQQATATLRGVRDIRRKRALTMQEREKAYEAMTAMPQISLTIYFDYDSDMVAPDGIVAIDELAKALKTADLNGKPFLIAGHTDAKGSGAYNIDLSSRRAEAVKRILVSKYAIAQSTLTTVGYGFEKLENKSDPTAAENRRVQMVRYDD